MFKTVNLATVWDSFVESLFPLPHFFLHACLEEQVLTKNSDTHWTDSPVVGYALGRLPIPSSHCKNSQSVPMGAAQFV